MELTDELFAAIGKFIVAYERVQASMKYVIIQNSLIVPYKKGEGKDLGDSKV